jgi:hypothetical protein
MEEATTTTSAMKSRLEIIYLLRYGVLESTLDTNIETYLAVQLSNTPGSFGAMYMNTRIAATYRRR